MLRHQQPIKATAMVRHAEVGNTIAPVIRNGIGYDRPAAEEVGGGLHDAIAPCQSFENKMKHVIAQTCATQCVLRLMNGLYRHAVAIRGLSAAHISSLQVHV